MNRMNRCWFRPPAHNKLYFVCPEGAGTGQIPDDEVHLWHSGTGGAPSGNRDGRYRKRCVSPRPLRLVLRAGGLTIVAQEDCRTEIKQRWDHYPYPQPTFWCPACQPPS